MKKSLIVLFILIVCLCIFIIYSAHNYYAAPSIKQPYLMKKKEVDTLRIAYIGDSWAFMHKFHSCRITQLLEDTLHMPVRVHSYGICGLTSKEIYDNIYNNYDFKQFLQKRGYTYCFVSAGINDTYKKMSTIYYKRSMNGIIEFLLANGVHPIILEIPDYNILKAFKRQQLPRKKLRRLSMFINKTPVDCKQLFRDAFDELIREKGYQEKVSLIRYKSWNNDYPYDLNKLYLEDGLHLNEHGYAKLDSMIAIIVLSSVKSKDEHRKN